MKSISSPFKVIFNTREFTNINILCFAEDHLRRLTKNNNACAYDSMIDKTSKKFYRLLEHQQEIDKLSKSKQICTSHVQKAADGLKELIRKLEGLIRSQFSRNSEIYVNVFPEGLSEYSRLNRSNIDGLVTRIIIFLKEYGEVVTPLIKKEINELYSEYKSKRNEQLKEFKLLESMNKEKKVIRYQLSHQLQKNLYLLAIEYLGKPDKASLFFNQEILDTKEELFIGDDQLMKKK